MSSEKNDEPATSVTDTILACMEMSSIHSLPNIAKSKNVYLRTLWLASLSIASGICGWFLVMSIQEYLAYETVSKININQVNEHIFPMVGICNMNAFASSIANRYITNYLGSYPSMNYENLATNLGDYTEKYYKSYAEQFGFSNLSAIVITCKFNMISCNLDNDFVSYWDPNYGNCFRYNSGKNSSGVEQALKTTTVIGVYGALELELWIGSSSSNYDIFSTENGINVFITNETTDSTMGEGVKMRPGESTYIQIDKYSISQTPQPYSDCTDGLDSISSYTSEIYKLTMEQSSSITYSFTNCRSICFQKLLAENCQCQTPMFDYFYNTTMRFCTVNKNSAASIADFICLEDAFKEFSLSSEYLIACNCPLECQTYGFTYSASHVAYPTRKYSDYLLNMSAVQAQFGYNKSLMTFENLQASVGKVLIFYNQMTETQIEYTIKIQVADLVSSVGGTFGLFMGFSCLSLVGIIEAIIQVCMIKINPVKMISKRSISAKVVPTGFTIETI